MKHQFDKKVRMNLDWNVGDKVWLNSCNISTTRPCHKLDDQWLGPFPISKVISSSAYKLPLPASSWCVHLVFHVLLLRKHHPNLIDGLELLLGEIELGSEIDNYN
ncbi:uncharacterized protein VP01_15173g1 [Puccinia sorghi]|uniref:Tf2-1-like SH3-like domain-containing protein n=1 Tax=Puccinia sorghi TaxID=27349 RepID=A0A0L6VIW5_9BASI|nr:uncharacterized protein VP01_15173g1 [Puccinia sorghi]